MAHRNELELAGLEKLSARRERELCDPAFGVVGGTRECFILGFLLG